MLLYLMAVLLLTHLDMTRTKFFDFSGRSYVTDVVPDWVLIIGGCACVFLICRIVQWNQNRVSERDSAKQGHRISWRMKWLLAALVLLVAQIIIVYNIWFYAGTDTSILWRTAGEFAAGRPLNRIGTEYLQQCPNNLYVYILYIAAHRVGAAFYVNGYTLMIALCVLLSNLAVQLSCDCTWRLTGNRTVAVCVWVLSALLFGLSPWMMIPYTDTLSIAIPVLTIDLYLHLRPSSMPLFWKALILILLPGFFAYLKILNVIVLIALAITEVLFVTDEKLSWKSCGQILAAVLVSAVLLVGLHMGAERAVHFQHDAAKELGIGYWIALGTNDQSYGAWNTEDVALMTQQESPEAVNTAAKQLLMERNRQYGLSGWLHLYVNKTHLFYDDGTFGWSFPCGYYDRIPIESGSTVMIFLRNFYYASYHYGLSQADTGYGAYYMVYAVIAQGLWMLTLLGITMLSVRGMLWRRQLKCHDCYIRSEKVFLWLFITWIGVFLFTMLFETSARLLISYLPVFTVMAGLGYASVQKRV